MSIEQQINQVRHTLSTVEALLVQAEESLKGCQQTQQTRLELAKAQIEYRLVKNATETLANMSKTQEMTVKGQQNYIVTLNRKLSRLQKDIAALTRQKVSMHRGLRALGGMWGNRRQIGLPRQRGRIIGVPAAAGGAPPTECESACGLTDRKIGLGSVAYYTYTLCYDATLAAGAAITTVTLNLAAAANVVIMAAVVSGFTSQRFQIQRPLGTDITDQWVSQRFGRTLECGDVSPSLHHLEACETLPAGAYTWNLVVTAVATGFFAYWLKAREVTCLPV